MKNLIIILTIITMLTGCASQPLKPGEKEFFGEDFWLGAATHIIILGTVCGAGAMAGVSFSDCFAWPTEAP